MGCSKGEIQVITLKNDGDKIIKEVNQVFKLEEQKATNVCLMHDSTDTLIAGCYQDGSVAAFDRETSQIKTFLAKTH